MFKSERKKHFQFISCVHFLIFHFFFSLSQLFPSNQLLGSITLLAWVMPIYRMRMCCVSVYRCIMQRAMNRSAMAVIQVVRRVLAVVLEHFGQQPIVQKRRTIRRLVRFHIQHQIYPWDRQFIRLHICCLICIHMVFIRHTICHCYIIRLLQLQWIIRIWTLIYSMLNWH